MNSKLLTLSLLSICSFAQLPQAPAPGGRGPARPPVRTITEIRDGLYKAENAGGPVTVVTVFLVTSDGIVLADPISPEFAAWLRGEFEKRFPGKPVKYVLYTHYHWDHARGGGIFSDTAKFIGQENMRKNLSSTIAEAPPPGDVTGLGEDNRISRAQAKGGTRGNFDRLDGDGDGFLTPAEINADIRPPDIVFSDRYTVTLGGKHVEMIWAKNRHTNDMTDMYFPEEKTLFVGDYIEPNRICCDFAFDRKPLSQWIASIKALEDLDFDNLISCHFESGTKADMIAYRHWLEDLQSAVATDIKEGKSLEEMQKTIRLDKYKSWIGYDQQLPAIIRSAYLNLTQYSPK